MAFVLDASATLPWCFQDEATPETDRLLGLAASRIRMYVPAHWPLEVLNGLTRAARRGRADDHSIDLFLLRLPNFNIGLDNTAMSEQWDGVLPLIRNYRLSAYDAGYLALAIRLQIPLATFDPQLRTAAIIEGVSLQI